MWRLLRRDWRAGELTVLGLALLVAVASLTSVGFLSDRVSQALVQESHQLLGGDLLLSADHPWNASVRAEARRRGLSLVDSIGFPSMVSTGTDAQLAEVKAVTAGYPLRGRLRISATLNAADAETSDIPASGTVWLDERLTTALKVGTGDLIRLGNSRLAVAAVLTQEPDRSMNMFGFAPRLLLNLIDLAATGLVQPASRISYRLLLAGEPEQIDAFGRWAKAHLGRGEKLEDMSNARPEMRSILERAQRFLRLAALLAVVLAAVAVGFAADRYMRRHLDGCAVMRCLGARQSQLLVVHGGEFLLFGLLATLAGCLVGYISQMLLQTLLSGLLLTTLPAPSWLPWAHGLLVGLVLLAGFAAPPLLRLRSVSTLRVLRREWATTEPLSLIAYGFGCLALTALMLWIADDLRLGAVVISGFAAALALYALLARGLLLLVGRIGQTGRPGLRLGLASLRRHSTASVLQATALGLGLTALLLLTVARQDLLASWQRNLPPDAPNRFIINIQPEQRQPLKDFFTARSLPLPKLEPMVRGRLVAINDQAITPGSYADERAQHLVDREFNLSWTATLPPGNSVTAGRWHGDQPADSGFSIEQGLAETLHLKLGDRLVYEIAGQRLTGSITSLRRLNWDSMHVNFFVITPPAMLAGFP
ncbi:MAG: ABC transporter permease, partial [Nevskiales bacterium]